MHKVEWSSITADEYYKEYFNLSEKMDVNGITFNSCKVTYKGSYPFLKREKKVYQGLYRKKKIKYVFYRNAT